MSKLKQLVDQYEDDPEIQDWIRAHVEVQEISHEEILESFLEDESRVIRSIFGEEEIDIPVDLIREY
jgi:hypothetical protein